MRIDRWELIEMIFQRVLESPPDRRREDVRDLCEGDEELASEVNSLLNYEHEAEAELQNMLAGELSALESVASSSEIGGKVGPYQLVRELDSGGMGVVYLAVRSDNQYFQIVAIKMIRRGVASSAVIQRFRDERQMLATLTHPNIGVILDGGETEDGRPFIVMEYVEGQPITAASAARGLGVRQKIDLFRSVCSAVHHAHQKLIIHRDIKPDNVLVTPEGVVKLIDFARRRLTFILSGFYSSSFSLARDHTGWPV
jgi:serine/threonine protein kinase